MVFLRQELRRGLQPKPSRAAQGLVPRSEACEEGERCSPQISSNLDLVMLGEGNRWAEGDGSVIRSD